LPRTQVPPQTPWWWLQRLLHPRCLCRRCRVLRRGARHRHQSARFRGPRLSESRVGAAAPAPRCPCGATTTKQLATGSLPAAVFVWSTCRGPQVVHPLQRLQASRCLVQERRCGMDQRQGEGEGEGGWEGGCRAGAAAQARNSSTHDGTRSVELRFACACVLQVSLLGCQCVPCVPLMSTPARVGGGCVSLVLQSPKRRQRRKQAGTALDVGALCGWEDNNSSDNNLSDSHLVDSRMVDSHVGVDKQSQNLANSANSSGSGQRAGSGEVGSAEGMEGNHATASTASGSISTTTTAATTTQTTAACADRQLTCTTSGLRPYGERQGAPPSPLPGFTFSSPSSNPSNGRSGSGSGSGRGSAGENEEDRGTSGVEEVWVSNPNMEMLSPRAQRVVAAGRGDLFG